MHGVAAAGPGFVAVGEENWGGVPAIWTSVDGVSWTRAALDARTFHNGTMLSVTDVGSGAVAVGANAHASGGTGAAVWVSADGISWSPIADPTTLGGPATIGGVAAGPAGLVAVGTGEAEGGANAAAWLSPPPG